MEHECAIAELGLVSMLDDINDPLANIQSCLEVLEATSSAPDDCLSTIKSSIEKMQSSIRDICGSFSTHQYRLYIKEDL
ncbi:MAG: hypothetical protein JWQ27_1910 [Ferruginibacter sp.]|nr:hypothetical protein [Ferruginibacter sp.]